MKTNKLEAMWVQDGKFKKIILIPVFQTKYTSIYCCHYCDGTFKEKDITKDHKEPLSKKGKDVPQNIVPACIECNREKADMPYLEYMRIVNARKKLKKRKDEVNLNKKYATITKVSLIENHTGNKK
jgi:5-methylcytosine-specific restriction endonuclease McrA